MSRDDVFLSAGIAVFVALAWCATFWLNTFLDPLFFEQTGVSWLFLPAGVRLVSVAVFRWDGVAGLSLGALVTSAILFDDPVVILATAALSGMAPLLALVALERSGLVQTNLERVTPLGVIAMCFTFAMVNVMLAQGFFLSYGISDVSNVFTASLAMFVGDLSGALIVVSLFSIAARFSRRRTAAQSSDSSCYRR